MNVPQFKKVYSSKFSKFMRSDMGEAFLRTLESQSPVRNVSATQGNPEQAIAFTENCRAYARIMELIESLAQEPVQADDGLMEFAPPDATDRSH